MLGRLLIAFSIAVLVISVLEGYYLFFYKPPSQSSISDPASSNGEAFIHNIFTYLKSNSTVIDSSIATTVYSGILEEVLDEPGVKFFVPYEKGLRIKSLKVNSQREAYIFLRKNDLSVLKVYSKLFGINREIKFGELKVGDKVEIVEEMNILADIKNSRVKFEIYKQ